MKTPIAAAFVLALLAAFLALPACTHEQNPGGPSITGKLLNCGADAVNKCASQALGPVNTCLASLADSTEAGKCLTGLIGPGLCGAETVIVCLVRQSGAVARAEAKQNADNEVSTRMAINAHDWIAARGYTFSGPPPALEAP
jgi:hypothetical protein